MKRPLASRRLFLPLDFLRFLFFPDKPEVPEVPAYLAQTLTLCPLRITYFFRKHLPRFLRRFFPDKPEVPDVPLKLAHLLTYLPAAGENTRFFRVHRRAILFSLLNYLKQTNYRTD
jgi:hypothetical protein